MSMLSSCTLMRLAPAGKLSPVAARAMQLHKQPAASSLVALPWAPCKVSRSRASLFACHAQENKFNILPSALVHPRTVEGDDWNITEDKEHITLKFHVGGSTKKNELQVETTEDQALLIIRYTGDSNASLAKSLDVRLLMPPGCDAEKMYAAMLSDGWLQITIPKPKHEPTKIDINMK